MEDSTYSRHQDLCQKLNMDATAASEAWRSYETIRQNYTLEVSNYTLLLRLSFSRLPSHYLSLFLCLSLSLSPRSFPCARRQTSFTSRNARKNVATVIRNDSRRRDGTSPILRMDLPRVLVEDLSKYDGQKFGVESFGKCSFSRFPSLFLQHPFDSFKPN